MGWVSFFQLAEKALWDKICLGLGGGARGGSRPPRMGLNASGALLCKAPGERSEDFCAAVRHKSNGIFQAVEKVQGLFDSLKN